MDLSGKVAVVTGGGRGIGAAIATALVDAGCAVAILGRDEAALSERTAALATKRGRIVARRCDIRSPSAVRTLISEIEATLGSIDILVNNAGGWAGEPLVEVSSERLDELVDTIVKGTMHMSRAVLPGMMKRRMGFILNIGSVSGLPVSRDSAIASAPKAAVASLTHALQQEVRASRIRVAVLHPDHVKSKPMLDVPLDRMRNDGKYTHISAAQVASVALFMLRQPDNVLLREVVVVPSGAEL